MVAIFEFCHKTFYGKYEVGLDPKPMSTSEIVLFVTVAIFAKSSILDIGRDPRSVSDKALLKRPLDGLYYIFWKSSGTKRYYKNSFLTT